MNPPVLRLFHYARNHRKTVWLATLCSVLNKLFDIAPEILIGVAIDVVVRKEDSVVAAVGFESPQEQIFLLALLTFLIWVGESIFEYLLLLLWRNLAQQVQHEARLDTYEHLQKLDMGFLEDQQTGNLLAIINDDVNQLERFLNGGANNLIQVATTLVGVGSVFFFISPLIATFAFMPIPFILLGAFYFQKRAQPLYRDVRNRVGLLSGRLSNNLQGLATIKSFTAEQRELKTLTELSENYLNANRSAIKISSAFIPVIRMAILSGFLLTLIIGGLKTINGELLASAYTVLVFLTQRLLWPLTGLAETVDLYERAMASTRRILDLLAVPISIRDGHEQLTHIDGHIKVEQLNFSYPGQERVLNDINIEVAPGSTVALIGQTGSGKSTIVKLLLRFYQPDSGKITIDGHDIQQLDLGSLRRQIGLVSQDIFLFDGSVEDNIRYGNPSATSEQTCDAAMIAEAHEFISKLPHGYQTPIGERGQKLSGGQRQRISIARAILKNPGILILDEATSAVDNETEAAIQRSLEKLHKNRTLLVIAHRLSTVVNADHIYVLDQGRVVEQGHHNELIASHGIYAKLWNVQTGGKLVA